jgi:hypothetical protein
MRKNQAYGKFLAVISTLFVFICGSAVTSVANVPKGETGRHDVSVKGHNADSHPVGDLTLAQGKQLVGDDIGILRGPKPKKLKTKSKSKNEAATTVDLHIFDNKGKVHGAPHKDNKSHGVSGRIKKNIQERGAIVGRQGSKLKPSAPKKLQEDTTGDLHIFDNKPKVNGSQVSGGTIKGLGIKPSPKK